MSMDYLLMKLRCSFFYSLLHFKLSKYVCKARLLTTYCLTAHYSFFFNFCSFSTPRPWYGGKFPVPHRTSNTRSHQNIKWIKYLYRSLLAVQRFFYIWTFHNSVDAVWCSRVAVSSDAMLKILKFSPKNYFLISNWSFQIFNMQKIVASCYNYNYNNKWNFTLMSLNLNLRCLKRVLFKK